ncbi:MAG TPA: hypothetical protein VK611_16525 [Acidimicrobiales bacterium]|nr:hypothetical protein [Acidimicrobiales bacterium]
MELDALLAEALATGDVSELRTTLNLGLVPRFAQAVGAMVTRPDPPVAALESLLDGWAALPVPGDDPEAILAGAAYAAYGEVGAVRPDWWDDEIAKLRRGATDDRRPVRETVAQALQRLLEADWPRTVEALRSWAADPAPLVVLAAAAAVAEPRLVRSEPAARDAVEVQRRAVAAYRSLPPERRRRDDAMTLRQTLGATLAVTGDLTLLEELASSDDPDLRWIARQNLG